MGWLGVGLVGAAGYSGAAGAIERMKPRAAQAGGAAMAGSA